MSFLAIYPKDINLGTGLLIALISIALVFVVLLIIILSVEGMHLFFKNKKEEVVEETVVKATVKENFLYFSTRTSIVGREVFAFVSKQALKEF